MTAVWDVAAAHARVRARIDAACARAGRDPATVQLLAASKFQPLTAIRSAYALGQRAFGENYVQELASKSDALADLEGLRWHLIGRLQRNKVKDVVRAHTTVQTLDSVRLCDALSARARQTEHVIEVLLQVNLASEPQKAGVTPSELPALADAARASEGLSLRGLMAIPKASDDDDETRGYFRQLRELARSLGVAELSMGMSDDLELAIEEGATIVRVGTALFGPRPA
jgi:pyridoxal phosphate enzyme (YggS family)